VNRLERHLDGRRADGRRSLVVYLCAGDPDLAATERLVPALAAAGADVIELGVPFSDPLADGPTIQAAAERALRSGTTLAGILDLVGRLRRAVCDVPLALMGYMNPIVRMGIDAFVAARRRGRRRRGSSFPISRSRRPARWDMPPPARGISLVLLAAPTTPPDRLRRIGERTRRVPLLRQHHRRDRRPRALPADSPRPGSTR
jgi:tryptophan synthase alpha chain